MRSTTLVSGLLLGTVGLVGLLGSSGSAHAAEECAPARTLMVLDKSSSMVEGLIDGKTKWQIAVDSIDAMTTRYESSVEMGLMTFPDPGACSPGTVSVTPALQSRADVMAALGAPPPTAGNWTPMAQSLDAAGDSPELMGTEAPKAIILVTDGWQYCEPYSDTTRFDPVSAVARLKTKGVRTYVVGFGEAVDVLALNRMAVEAGTAKVGCDPADETIGGSAHCYHDAANAGELAGALQEIGGVISAEECDGLDNDCDGIVDEGCACAGGATPEAEICDGIDNNCDGVIDEDDGTLCPGGGTCNGGTCGAFASYGDSAGGCACRVGERRETSAGVGLAGVLLGLLGLVALRGRRAR